MYAVPSSKGPGLPDLTGILKQRNPPVFKDLLLKKLLVCVNGSMGTLRPFQLGIHTVQPWHVKIVYKVLLTNMRDATRVVMLIGCAIAKQNVSADYQRKLEISMKNNRIKIFHPRNYQLLEKKRQFQLQKKCIV